MSLLVMPLAFYGTAAGALAGGKLYTYIADTDTLTPSYTTAAFTTAHANPVEADIDGIFPAIFLKPGDYKLILYDSSDNLIWTHNDYGVSDPSADLQAQVTALQDQLDNLSTWNTGDWRMTWRSTPETGWVIADDGTIGNASSNASNRANNDTEDLFTVIWNAVDNDYAPVFTSGGSVSTRGASAAEDWAANKRLQLGTVLSRVLGIAGQGSGLSLWDLGETTGEEEHTPTISETALHGHPWRHNTQVGDAGGNPDGGITTWDFGSVTNHEFTGTPTSTSGQQIGGKGGGSPFNVVQPSVFCNVEFRL